MIVITGAAGFIGSCLVRKFNDEGYSDLILVDEFNHPEKNRNLEGKQYLQRIDRQEFLAWFNDHAEEIDIVFHIGARTDTTEKDTHIFDELNLNYSKSVWKTCARHHIPLIYASSAATYGLGEHGYDDRHDIVKDLHPLNPYGLSKNDFDAWALEQRKAPPLWIGLKFFNVYGPNEYHKGRMASVIFHTVRQIKATGMMKLFRSHRPDIADGYQSRDFIYIKDVIDICYFFFLKALQDGASSSISGLYNVGTGKARTFLDLATLTFKAMDLEPRITFIDTPADIRDTYQYFTEARMDKLRSIGYQQEFFSLEAGIDDYVRHYLLEERIW